MIYNGKRIDFPTVNKISFFKLFETLEKMVSDSDKGFAEYARKLLKDLEPYQVLRDGFEDRSLLKKHKKVIDRLLRFVMPDALTTNEIKAITSPFGFTPFRFSERFEKLIKGAGPNFNFDVKDIDKDLLYIIGCSIILGSYYKWPVDIKRPFFFEIPDKKNKIIRHFRMAFNADLTEMIPTSKAPKITKEDYYQLINDFDNIALWKEKFPPNSYIMRGIGIMNLMDVSMDRSAASITSALLNKSKNSLEMVEQNTRQLLNIPDLKMNFLAFENNTFFKAKNDGYSSFLLGGDDTIHCEECFCQDSYRQLLKHRKPLAISDVEHFNSRSDSIMSKNLAKSPMKSYLLYPIIYNDHFLGMVEMGSPRKYDLTSVTIHKLEDVIPIIAIAANRFMEEKKLRLEAIIQEEYTAIHPSVKWRFEEEAYKHLMLTENEEVHHFKDLVFKEVYPFFGQLDIKGSSTKRNEAIQSDLMAQMKDVLKVLQAIHKKNPMPIYEEFMYQVRNYIRDIKKELSAGSEHNLMKFLQSDIYPIFEHIKATNKRLAKTIDKFKATLDPDLNTLYKERKKFDESVQEINQVLANYLDQKQEEAQKMFPHYFERYKTDGVEFNIYLGQSLVKDETFNSIYLNNLRLWQLITMCEMENRFHQIRKTLKTPLEIASLILVYSTPISIHFRLDEKQFDVEGAYNARYEIIKKRVDKAYIKGTKERLTKPGKIVVIYTAQEDADEYKRYISFLKSKGLLTSAPVENVKLENLPGVSGLKALRATINYTKSLSKEGITTEELIRVIEENAEASKLN